MNEQIETGLVAFLATQLANGTIIRKGTEIREKPVGERLIIAAVRDVPREVGSLYNGMLTLLVQTPIVLNADGNPSSGLSPADHSAMVEAVEAAMNPRLDPEAEDQVAEAARVAAIKTALDTAVRDAAGFSCTSTYCEGPQSAHNDKHWITTLDVLLGLQRL